MPKELTKKEMLAQEIARFEASERQPDDYLAFILASARALRGLDGPGIDEAINEGLRLSGRAAILPPAP